MEEQTRNTATSQLILTDAVGMCQQQPLLAGLGKQVILEKCQNVAGADCSHAAAMLLVERFGFRNVQLGQHAVGSPFWREFT